MKTIKQIKILLKEHSFSTKISPRFKYNFNADKKCHSTIENIVPTKIFTDSLILTKELLDRDDLIRILSRMRAENINFLTRLKLDVYDREEAFSVKKCKEGIEISFNVYYYGQKIIED